MNITLIHKLVQQVELKRLDDGEIEQENELKLTFGTEIFHNQKDTTLVKFRHSITVVVKDEVSVGLIYDFTFKTDASITDEFNESEEAVRVIPNLAYPYIKTYVENILVTSGYKDISLPYLNFYDEPLKPAK
ncbi:hypothetical protein J7S75_06465 [Providencia huaxiensis]|uniref:hypothetical protein n=1 Tax=Providencia huaxiensis TaxID=2027290 RepID=UPI001B38C182|nr:hypothetical protein [Providencia huaxiensis]MBQ0533982.1 hypothetical protein [Providencia huaxiensis]MBQ0588681.1 hypothetical protein [Providencia huaxiensis]